MPQFTVYGNSNPATRRRLPFLLDVQSNLLEDLATRVVVPLTRADRQQAATVKKLMPILVIDGQRYVMITPQVAGVPRKALGAAIGDVSERRGEIIAALDFLLTGI